MRPKFLLSILVIAIFILPSKAPASTVLDEADVIMGMDVAIFPFTANVAPFTYLATLADLSEILEKLLPPGSDPGFVSLSLSVSDEDGNFLGSVEDSGSFTFDVVERQRYFAFVLGDTADDSRLGAFGVTIEAVPIPTTLMLLGSGLLGLIYVRRRSR
jgi:hypothetical protein